ncbi:hypothetical protein SDC9_173310 [bioreactor metagenome]|uniref:Uncharacterized protein n=1 Tax=bioreactor metagenome TaxID=1076179 RepID=A0A645GJ22_9ZZZZ|nr:hypothetical protein [Oscillospiraceae bacterium]
MQNCFISGSVISKECVKTSDGGLVLYFLIELRLLGSRARRIYSMMTVRIGSHGRLNLDFKADVARDEEAARKLFFLITDGMVFPEQFSEIMEELAGVCTVK